MDCNITVVFKKKVRLEYINEEKLLSDYASFWLWIKCFRKQQDKDNSFLVYETNWRVKDAKGGKSSNSNKLGVLQQISRSDFSGVIENGPLVDFIYYYVVPFIILPFIIIM